MTHQLRHIVVRLMPVLSSRGVGAVMTLVSNIAVAGLFGPVTASKYFLVFGVVQIVGTAVAGGYPIVALREASHRRTAGLSTDLVLAFRRITASVLLLACIALFVGCTAPNLLSMGIFGSWWMTLLLLAGVYAFAMNVVVAASLKGRGMPAIGIIVEWAIAPSVVLAVLIGWAFAVPRTNLTSDLVLPFATSLYPLAVVVATLVGLSILVFAKQAKSEPNELREVRSPTKPAGWQLWLSANSNTFFSRFPILVLPVVASEADLSYYVIASNLASVGNLVTDAAQAYFAPQVVRAYASTGAAGALSIYWRSSIVVLAAAIPVALLLFVFGPAALPYLGDGSTAAVEILYLVVALRVVILAFGPSDVLLGLCGQQKYDLCAVTAGLGVAGLILALLGSYYGVFAVVSAQAAAIVVRRVVGLALFRALARRDLAPSEVAPFRRSLR